MSKRQKSESNREPESLVSGSVYDFLFQDSRRVGSLLAQFDPSGHLQSVKQVDAISESYLEGTKLKGGANLAALKGEAANKNETSGDSTHRAERDYDPLWVNAINLLDFLHQRNLLVRDLSSARLGQIVLATGKLSVFDMATIRKVWEDPSILRKIIGLIGDKSKAANLEKHSSVLKMLSIMPHPVQATLDTKEGLVWTILTDSCLEIAASNLFLKYGTEVSGEWNMLGILDAMPNSMNSAGAAEPKEVNTLIDLMHSFQALARHLGRPAEAYGFTPLLIFRELK